MSGKNKSQMIDLVSEEVDLSKRATKEVVNTFLDSVKERLADGEKVTLTGFGTFSITHRKARNGVNPQTGEEIRIPAKDVPKFKASKNLRELIE